MTKKAFAIGILLIVIVVFVLVFSLLNFTDNSLRRRRTVDHIQRLVERIRVNPSDQAAFETLMGYTKSGYLFGACAATASMRDLEPTARPIIPILIELLKSQNHCVAREAAIALSEFGPMSTPAREALEAQLLKGEDRDVDWFSAEALGNLGPAGVKSLPVLRRRLGTGSDILDEEIANAIEKLEAFDETDEDVTENLEGECN